MERSAHPYETWRLGAGLSYAQVAARLRQKGLKAQPKYVEQICRGWYRPSGTLALAMSEVSDGAVGCDEILSFQYSSSAKRSAA